MVKFCMALAQGDLMVNFINNSFPLQRFLKILKWFVLVLVVLVTVLYGVLHLSGVQTWLVKRIAKNLSQQLETRVTLKKVDFRFFDKLLLKDLMVEDRKKDTLLFAGTASANVTDWFFLKDTITLNNVGLEDAIINMNRTDSVWNYQFLVDFFSPPSTGKKSKSIQFDIKELHLQNVQFNQQDKWVGQDMLVSLQKLDVTMNKLDVARKQIFIKDIYLEKPIFQQRSFEGRKPKVINLEDLMAKIPVVSAFKWNKSGWVFKLDRLQIFDGTFLNDKLTNREAYAGRFDGQHIRFSDINGSMNNVLFLNDTLHADLSVQGVERSGLEIKKFDSHFKFTPELMEFKELDLQTNRSRLGNYYSMQYSSFNKDMSSFINNVTLHAIFKESVLSTDDLAFFSPALASMKRLFYIEGDAKGTIDNFSARDLKLRTGNTYFDGNLAMRGLPDINSTFIDLRSNLLQTNYNELATIIPALKKVTNPAIYKLGNIKYTGNFTGFTKDFVAFGNISTNLGSIKGDLNMKLPTGAEAVYSGSISTGGFQLGQFLNNKQLGLIAINGAINGRSFSLDKLDANFKGQVQRLDYGGYAYRNVQINGNFKNQVFKGHASINDPNIQLSRIDGELSLLGKQMAFNASANLEHVNLQKIGLSKDLVTLSGIFNLNFTGNTIDNFLGFASVRNARLQHDSTTLSFDSLLLQSSLADGRKTLSVQTNELDASITGDFTILQLPDAFKFFLAKYYPEYIKAPNKAVSNQDFIFNITTANVDTYVSLFDKRLGGLNNSRISGSLNLNNYALKLNAFVPEFTYDKKQFLNITVDGTGNRDTLFADIAVDDIIISDSLHFPDTKLTVAAHNNLSLIKLNTSAGKTLNNAELNASILSMDDGIRIHFYPSSFVVNNKNWLLAKDGELTLRKNYIDASEVRFVHEKQEIVLSTELDDVTDDIHLLAKLQNVVLEDFLPFFMTKPSLKGQLTGVATITDPMGKRFISFQGAADSFSLDNKYLGKVNLDGSVNTVTGLIKYKVNTNEPDYVLDIDGFMNIKDSTGERMRTSIKAEKLNLNILEPYLRTIFSQVDGTAHGDIVLAGTAGQPMTILGDVNVDSGSFKVAFTQCRYNITNETISFKEGLIDLGTIRLTDSLNNLGTASGKLYHQFFNNFRFEDVRVETGKMLVLNTTKKDNPQFYGNVIGSALLTIQGPTTAMIMNINGQPSVFDSSHIYLNTNVTAREVARIDYIDFVQFGTEMDQRTLTNKAANILVNMNITANPGCKVDLILDEETGDVIKGQGNGKLNIRVGTTEALSIRGQYEITKGEYTFNFQTFVKKPFTLSEGTITWNGDPLLATIDIDAEYLAKNVDVSSITQASSRKEDITIISNLSGSLTKPQISFEFQLPENSDLNRDYYTTKKLADFKNNENEMFKQVASLLLVNAFMTEGSQGFISGGSTLNIGTSMVGGIISGYLTSMFNKELERATNGVISTYIDINPTVDLQNTAKQLQANVRAGLKILLSSKVNVIIGGNLDYNNPYLQNSGLITPDITIEWLLNKDGSVRVVGFNKTSTDLTSNQRNRSGLQLSYRKDFDNISDIFKPRKRILVPLQDSIQVRTFDGSE